MIPMGSREWMICLWGSVVNSVGHFIQQLARMIRHVDVSAEISGVRGRAQTTAMRFFGNVAMSLGRPPVGIRYQYDPDLG